MKKIRGCFAVTVFSIGLSLFSAGGTMAQNIVVDATPSHVVNTESRGA